MRIEATHPAPGVTRIIATLYHFGQSSSIWTPCGKRAALPSVFVTSYEREVNCRACISHLKKVETP